MRAEDGFVTDSIGADCCIEISQDVGDVVSWKGCEKSTEGVVECVFTGISVRVSGGVTRDYAETAMLMFEGGD